MRRLGINLALLQPLCKIFCAHEQRGHLRVLPASYQSPTPQRRKSQLQRTFTRHKPDVLGTTYSSVERSREDLELLRQLPTHLVYIPSP
jgi:hypothetical protein